MYMITSRRKPESVIAYTGRKHPKVCLWDPLGLENSLTFASDGKKTPGKHWIDDI